MVEVQVFTLTSNKDLCTNTYVILYISRVTMTVTVIHWLLFTVFEKHFNLTFGLAAAVWWDRSCLHRTLLITAKARSNRRFPDLSTVTKPLKDLQTCLYARKTTQLPQKDLLKSFQWTLKVWWVQRVSFSYIQMSLDGHFGPGRYTSLQALCKVWCRGG